MKLIDAEKLAADIDTRIKANEDSGNIEAAAELKAMGHYITQLAPAYDTKKVVNKLTELTTLEWISKRVGVKNKLDYQKAVTDAIGIVQTGGRPN